MSILASIVGWRGFRSWKFWTGGLAAVALSWVLITNVSLNNKVAKQSNQIAIAESQLGESIKINKELNENIVSLQQGKAIDEEIVKDNQAEIDRMRKEHNERVQEINRQGPSGPAPAAIICAITRVCD